MTVVFKDIRVVAACALGAALAHGAGARGQAQAVEQFEIAVDIDSGYVTNAGAARAVIFSQVVEAGPVSWLRLTFDVALLGAPPTGGEPTILRLTSIRDAAEQRMRAEHVAQWERTSAYFNGNAVRVEIIADPGAAPSRLRSTRAFAGFFGAIPEESLCDGADDRLLSNDPRVARKFPSGCTVFLIDDTNHTFLTAGHCTDNLQVVEFNVPLSTSDGAAQHPGPEDQYVVDPASMQSNGGQGAGDDWAYFGCFANTNSGLWPFEAQGQWFTLAPAPFETGELGVTGYGVTSDPVPPEWNRVQKSHSGPLIAVEGSTLQYRVDTTGGNSGSPVIDRDSGWVVGIHTHGGCETDFNKGTSIDHLPLQDALANPQGVCASLCVGDIDADGGVDFDDLLLVVGAWGPCEGCEADIDGDGIVELPDIQLILAAWGDCE